MLTSTTQTDAGTLKNAAINNAFCHGGAQPSCITTAHITAVVITRLTGVLSAPCTRITARARADASDQKGQDKMGDEFVH
ncbi:TPA: hypothetical protein HH295_19955 [Xanthomonas vasicola pv. zeae]|nr:hypothetical protein [Xanthomonas vasicola pv. vasculorum]HHZ32823.1 hypothetical protein [Xanthomonas vasicola pv. zeae]HHZ56913.1 hypothetical protein [Xanthomonas vasicola pv. zeae]